MLLLDIHDFLGLFVTCSFVELVGLKKFGVFEERVICTLTLKGCYFVVVVTC